MGSILGFFAAPARLKGLLIGAAALLLLALSLTTWALLERSGKLAAERDAEHFKAQSQVFADSLGRCNAGVEAAAKAGNAAQADVKRLLGMAETAMLKTAALREEARAIVSKTPPVRPDGKLKDCSDALGEIRQKVKP